MIQEILLDVRHLDEKEAEERVLRDASELFGGQYIKLVDTHEPEHLIQLLEQRKFHHRTSKQEDSRYEIEIWPGDGNAPHPDYIDT